MSPLACGLKKMNGLCHSCVDAPYNRPTVAFSYINDLLSTSKIDPSYILEQCNRLQPKPRFTIERLDEENEIVFLDMKISKTISGY